MNIRHKEIVVDKGTPFINCKLNREQYAEVLTSIVGNYADGFVLAINNEWGTGKTTFVKMWQQQLRNQGFNTLYFNAWENDFDSNPMVAIMAELKTLINDTNQVAFKAVLKKGAVLTKSILPALVKALAEKYINTKVLVDAIENTAKAATEILDEEIKEYASRKRSLDEFRNELEKFIGGINSDKPIVFIVDELDRCRPNYAVEVLEQIKHFFSVNGIVFALSIDKVQLGHAIRGVYGSEKLNAEGYLKRFIDLEYSIPAPDTKQSCEYFYDYYQFEEFFKSAERKKIGANDYEYFLQIAIYLFRFNNVTLRQQEKVFAHARVALKSFVANNYLFPEVFLYLCFIRSNFPDFYTAIRTQALSINAFATEFYKTVSPEIDEYERGGILNLQALLVVMYHRFKYEDGGSPHLIEVGGNYSLNVTSNLDRSAENVTYKNRVKAIYNSRERRASISYILDKIDLLQNIMT